MASPPSTTTNTENNNNKNKEPPIIPYETLKSIADSTNLGIDPRHKELALSDEEFENIFQMSKESFASLANWKKTQLKKAASLF
jgi:predicted double-glycine peptidase